MPLKRTIQSGRKYDPHNRLQMSIPTEIKKSKFMSVISVCQILYISLYQFFFISFGFFLFDFLFLFRIAPELNEHGKINKIYLCICERFNVNVAIIVKLMMILKN